MQLPTSDGARAWNAALHGGLTGTLATGPTTTGSGGEAGVVGSGGATAGAYAGALAVTAWTRAPDSAATASSVSTTPLKRAMPRRETLTGSGEGGAD